MFVQCDYHYLQRIEIHPQKGTVQTKIVDLDRPSGQNSPKARPARHSSASSEHLGADKRRLQVNSVVEVYFYHKEEVPSDEEAPVPKKSKKKVNPEQEAIQLKELEELRQESRVQFEAMCKQTFDDMREIISTIIDRDLVSTTKMMNRSRFPLSDSDDLALSEEAASRKPLSLRKLDINDAHSELLTPCSKLSIPQRVQSEPRRSRSVEKWWQVQRVLF